MTLTNNMSLNYPLSTDPVAVPLDLQNLAVDTEYAISTLNARTAGPVLVSQAYNYTTGVVEVVNTTATTNLVSLPIAESDTSAVYDLFMFGTYFNNSGASRTFTMNCNLGATTLFGGTSAAFVVSATERQWVSRVRLHVFGYQNSLGYLYLPGVAGNYASAPDSAALDITGDIDIRCKVALDDWTPSVAPAIISKRSGVSTQFSYLLYLNTNGTLGFGHSPDGTTNLLRSSTVAPTVSDGQTLWIRATLDVDNGAGGHDVKFYTSVDGITWTQLGATVTNAGTTSLFSGTAEVGIGGQFTGTSSLSKGKFYRAQILNGIGGTVAFDADFETAITSLRQRGTFTESSANAATVTINRTNSQLAFGGLAVTTAGATASQFAPTMGQVMTQVYGTATEDLSTSKNLVVTFAHSAANASLRLRLLGYTLVRLVA